MSTFFVSLGLVVFGAIFQNSGLALWGVKPNIVLVTIIAFALMEKDWLRRSALALLGAAGLIIEPSLGLETVFTLAVFFFCLVLTDRLPWRETANGVSALVAGTLLINLDGFQPGVFFAETAYNLALLGVLALIFLLFEMRYSR